MSQPETNARELPDYGYPLICSFCGKIQAHCWRVIQSRLTPALICDECVEVCAEICKREEEKQVEAEKQETPPANVQVEGAAI